jgi:hypothetical protein
MANRNEHSKRASATKSGPGRYHSAGCQKASPVKSAGAPRGFVLHTNAEKRNRRDRIKALGGIRQFKRWEREAAKNAPAGY